MNEIKKIFFKLMLEHKVYPNKKNLTMHLDKIFNKIDFKDKSVLDIGGGSGLHSFYAFIEGASFIDCIEPESDGSSTIMKENFLILKKKLNASNVNFLSKTFQEFECKEEKYDYILTYNVINHLNEKACINVDKDLKSRKEFEEIFEKIHRILKPSGKILVADCGRKNFFGDLGILNPFAKDIDWLIHQEPQIWIRLLKEQGFVNLSLKWSTFNTLGKLGKFLFERRLFSYLTLSHFYFWMQKK